jgi:hypothetical protein
MPATIQDCIDYVNTHIYENTEQEVSADEVKTAFLMLIEVIQTFVPKGEFVSDSQADSANLNVGDTYITSENNEFGLPRGFQKTFFKP